MNELTVIVDLIAKLGAEGREAFIWWLIMDRGLSVVGWLMSLAVLSWLTLTLFDRISRSMDMTQRIERLRDTMEVGCSGEVCRSELREMQAWVEKHKHAG